MQLLRALRRPFLRRPLDWTTGAGRVPAERPDCVDVIVPVYGAAAELEACLASVAANTSAAHGLILVVDGPQNDAVDAIVNRVARDASATIIRNDARAGFVASVNRGMRVSSRDVVLLNSDTLVTPRWLEKMITAAYSNGDVGTVTPLSNNATLVSVPRAFEENLLPAGWDVTRVAEAVERVSRPSYVRLPTAVGFCMYIRRALIDDIGVFDEARFGAGYGEENDFCLRALARGWLHVADDATFVYHAGHRSFSSERHAQQRHSRRALAKRHPRYDATIAAFLSDDPLGIVRDEIHRAIKPPKQPAAKPLRIVHLVHGWPPFQNAGTELYARWLAAEQVKTHEVAIYARASDPSREEGEAVELLDDGMRVRLVTNNFTLRDPLRRNALRDRDLERDFARFLRDERPDLIHIHHLAGHAFSLAQVARADGVPVVMQVQDWWFLCARVNLLDRDGRRCSGPEPAKCAACATLTKLPPQRLANRALHAIRRSAARDAFTAADAWLCGSNAIRDDYAGLTPDRSRFHVIPYAVPIDRAREPRPSAARPLRFGYVGSIAPHKGVHTAVDAMRGLDPADASLHLWGDSHAFPEFVSSLRTPSNVIFEGRFDEGDKPRVFASMDALLVPSIGLESFGLAAREAMASRVPVIATAGGALSEMFAPGSCGEFFAPGDSAALRAILQRLIADPSILDAWSRHLPEPKSLAVHALEIEAVYRHLLEERSR